MNASASSDIYEDRNTLRPVRIRRAGVFFFRGNVNPVGFPGSLCYD